MVRPNALSRTHSIRAAIGTVALGPSSTRVAEVEDEFARVCDELSNKGARQEVLANEVSAAEDWLRRLQQALEAAKEVGRRRDELSSAEADTRIAADQRTAREEVRTQCRATLHRCQDDHKRAGAGLADIQRGLDELHRRAGAYRQMLRRKGEAERLLEVDELAIGTIAGRMAECKAQLEQVDRSRRDAKRRLADADEHRREHTAALSALELMADAAIEPGAAHRTDFAPAQVRELAARGLWLEQERIVLDPRIPDALEAVLTEDTLGEPSFADAERQ